MATKQAVSKTQAVRDYLNAHPGAGIREIVAALDKQGIKITLSHVATIKAVMYETADRRPHRSTASRGKACHRYAHARADQDACPSDEKDTVTPALITVAPESPNASMHPLLRPRLSLARTNR